MALSAVLFAALTLQAGGEPSAEDALRRSMDRTSSVNIDAILVKSAPWGGNPVRLRLCRDASGRLRTEILSPVEMQGQISVDDGKTWTTYIPEDRKIRIHPSPMAEPDDLDFRMRLIRKNYRLEIDQKPTIAGRAAIRVVATPRSSTLETRRFYLDASNYVLLKTDMVSESGPDTVFLSVQRIEFPARFERGTFDPPQIDNARRDVAKPPLTLKDADDAERRVGFRPATPGRLPYGFRPQGLTLWDWGGITPVQVRLTDGLARLSVFQFRIPEGAKPRPGDERKVAKTVGDIRIEVRGDAPQAVREKILDIYATYLARGQKAQDSGDGRKPKG